MHIYNCDERLYILQSIIPVCSPGYDASKKYHLLIEAFCKNSILFAEGNGYIK